MKCLRPSHSLGALFVAVAIGMSLGPAAGAEPLWTVSTESNIVFQRITPLGSLLVSTESDLSAIDPASGKVLWRRPDIRKLKECNYDEIPNTPYGLVDLGTGMGGMKRGIEILDLQKGQPRWDTMDLPLASSLGLIEAPHRNLVMLIGTPREGGKPTMVAIDAETGRTKWHQAGLFDKPLQLFQVAGSGKVSKRYSIEGNQAPVFETEHTAILWLSEDGPIKIDLDSGRRLWVGASLQGLTPPATRSGFAPVTLGEGVAFVPFEHSLQALDLATGAPLWSKAPSFKARVTQMELTPHGLVVRGAPAVNEKGKRDGKAFLDLIDPKTGVSRWKKTRDDLGNATTFDVREGEVFIAAGKELLDIDLASGASHTVAKLEFKGNEAPTRLEAVDGGWVLSSDHNLMRIGSNGAVEYHAFYGAAGGTGRSIAANPVARPSVMFLDPGASSSVAPRFPLASRNATIARRYQASLTPSGHAAVLTHVEVGGKKGAGLVKIEKASGKETARIVLGDKSPEVLMDRLDNRVFVVKSSREVVCYEF